MRTMLAILCLLPGLLHAAGFQLDPGAAGEWQTNAPSNQTVAVTVTKGPAEAATRIDYAFNPGEWVEVMRSFDPGKTQPGAVTFLWRGTPTGAIFELKFSDEDNTVFGLKMPTSGLDPEKWNRVTIPWKDLHVMWGGNMKLDPIKKIGFALSGLGGKGFIEISEFKSQASDSFNVEIEADQIGYHPRSRKEFVIRALDLPKGVPPPQKVPFVVRSKKASKPDFKGIAELSKFNDWPGVYYLGDFTGLEKDGEYLIEADFDLGGKIRKLRSHDFEIGPRVFSRGTARLEFEFLKNMQCGDKCHTVTPLKGGYHDTRFDISQRMWAIPSMVIGVREYAKHAPYQWDSNNNDVSDSLEELAFGVEFCAKFPEPDGTVSWGGIESDFEKAGLTIQQWLALIAPMRAEDDKFERRKFKDKNFHATCFNLVAVTEGWPLIKKKHSDLENVVTVTRQKSWDWIQLQPLKDSRDYGCYLDAATACYESTGDKKYLERVPEVTAKLLALQALDYSKMERQACGDFFNSAAQRNFLWHYKTTSFNIAIYRSLLRLAGILKPDDPLYPAVRYANEVFSRSYLKAMASKTPYRQLADNLEMSADGKFKIFYFAGSKAAPTAAEDHGLNCDHFALGWAALKWAQETGDLELQQLAEDQIHWALGKNPLGVSMVMGVGEKNPVIIADFWNKTLPGSIINGPASLDGQTIQYKPEHFGHSEEWLPHNADYLRLLGSVEADGKISGRVTDGGKPVEDADIKISAKDKTVYRGKTDAKGRWSSPPLPYGQSYAVRVSRGAFGGAFGDQIHYEMNLAAGAEKEIETRLNRHFAIRIEHDDLQKDKPAKLRVRLENESEQAVTPKLKAYVRGAELKSEPQEVGAIESEDEAVIEYEVVPTGKEPFYFYLADTEQPQISTQVYELP